MSNKKKVIRSATGRVIDSNTVKTYESMDQLKPDDIVVIIHADDYKDTFESMMKKIQNMDEKVTEQSQYLNVNLKDKGFLGRFRKRKD